MFEVILLRFLCNFLQHSILAQFWTAISSSLRVPVKILKFGLPLKKAPENGETALHVNLQKQIHSFLLV